MEECLKSGIKLLLIFCLKPFACSPFDFVEKRVWSYSSHFLVIVLLQRTKKAQNAVERREPCCILFQMLNISSRSLGVRRKQNWVYKWHSSLDFFLSLSPLPCSFSFLALFCFFFRVLTRLHFSAKCGKCFRIRWNEVPAGNGTRFSSEFWSQLYMVFYIFLRRPWLDRVHCGIVWKISPLPPLQVRLHCTREFKLQIYGKRQIQVESFSK